MEKRIEEVEREWKAIASLDKMAEKIDSLRTELICAKIRDAEKKATDLTKKRQKLESELDKLQIAASKEKKEESRYEAEFASRSQSLNIIEEKMLITQQEKTALEETLLSARRENGVFHAEFRDLEQKKKNMDLRLERVVKELNEMRQRNLVDRNEEKRKRMEEIDVKKFFFFFFGK